MGSTNRFGLRPRTCTFVLTALAGILLAVALSLSIVFNQKESAMVECVQFVLVGNDAAELSELANCLRLIVAHVVSMSPSSAEQSKFDGRHVVLIDIDCESGMRTAHRVAYLSPDCLVATLSERDRPADKLMHIIKPIGLSTFRFY